MSARETTTPETSPTTSIERRTYVRLATDLEAKCRKAGGVREVGWPGSVHDISLGGIGLLLSHRFQPGTDLAVELRDDSGVIRRIVRARVVHASPTTCGGNSCWLLGCAFDAPLTEEELEALR